MTPHDAIRLAADVIAANGFHRHYLWDTAQAQAGTPPEDCRVDIAGALAIALHGHPAMAHTPEVHAAEQLLVARIDAPSLAAWYHRRPTLRQVLDLLDETAAQPSA
ncbi:hypothetical protein ADK53_28625 [Streptomyces sp. WM6373]|uniref:DUF6197 family protein n=1 Tax=Streptomyces sp. WM6373 TaxID=1415556 RepID=UPI0006AE8518|nr:hypothetical protein [Streptomyces sp. WM6373]KOU30186.1 hypothetical protein ADK53_28625 [Streptomyces sp. WM6373]